MKALVTGASGFIGSHIVDRLLTRGYDVRVLLRRTSSTEWLDVQRVERITGDLFDEEALRQAVDGVDYIYHSAGLTKAKTEAEYFRANTVGTTNLLRAAVEGGQKIRRFVFISSQTASGPSPGPTPMTEEAPPHPITTYGRSKLQAEQECMKVSSQLPFTIVRPPAVFGPRDKDIFEYFHTFSRGLQPMVGFSEKYLSLIHVTDLVRGVMLAGESPKAAGQTYFISSDRAYGWKEVGEVTRAAMGKRAVRVRIPEPAVYLIAGLSEFFSLFSTKPALVNLEKARDMVQQYWTCDSSKARRDFGYGQEISLEEGIRTTIEWYRKHGWM